MKKTFPIFCILILFSTLFAQAPDTLWTKTYGGQYDDVAFECILTDDGGCLIGGFTQLEAENQDLHLIKTDIEGDTLWTKTYGEEFDDCAFSLFQTQDHRYIAAGIYAQSEDDTDFWLLNLSETGDTLWTRTYGGEQEEICHSVLPTWDGGYILAGSTKSFGAGDADFWLVKTNYFGDTLWTRTFGGESTDYCKAMAQSNDGGYILAGCTESFGSGDKDVWLIKTDSNGDSLWTKTYGGTECEEAFDIINTIDNGYLITGTYDWYSEVYLIKTDFDGDSLWTNTYGEGSVNYGMDSDPTSDYGFVTVGFIRLNSGQPYNILIIETNNLGDTLWTKTVGGADFEFGYNIKQTPDNGYLVAGSTESFGTGGSDIYLVRLEGDSTKLYGNRKGTIYCGDYHVVGDIIVADEDSLIVEPGTRFYFDGNFDIEVYGYFSAVGTETDSIYFLPFMQEESWGGVIFRPSMVIDGEISYAYFTGASIGAINIYQTDPLISHCKIEYNSANWGGGIYISWASPTISECYVAGNYSGNNGGGIYCTGSDPSITNCIIENNYCLGPGSGHGGGGVAFNHSASGYIADCLIINNSSGYHGGGVAINDNSNVLMENCTISGNHADSTAGGILIVDYCSAVIKNTIIEGNTGSTGVFLFRVPDVSITFNDIYGNEYGDIGGDSASVLELGIIQTFNLNYDSCDAFLNIYLDPLYLTTTGDSAYHLSENSPCIDAGHYLSPYDPDNTLADIGKYYFDQSLRVDPSEKTTTLPDKFRFNPPRPNPFNPETTISFELPQSAYVRLIVYDVQGRVVAKLIDGEILGGSHEVKFDASNLSSGIYFAGFSAGNYKAVRKLLLLK